MKRTLYVLKVTVHQCFLTFAFTNCVLKNFIKFIGGAPFNNAAQQLLILLKKTLAKVLL